MMNAMQSLKNDVFYLDWHRKMRDMMLNENVASTQNVYSTVTYLYENRIIFPYL